MRKISCLILILLGFYLVSVTAATSSDTYSQDEIGYDKFFDLQGGFKLVLKDNDIYVYGISKDVGERRITHTPKLNKPIANFAKDRAYIIYAEYTKEGANEGELRYYRVNFADDDNNRQRISKEEYNALVTDK